MAQIEWWTVMFVHPLIICFTLLNNIQEADTYLHDSATSPDCYIRTARSPVVETVESGADEANRTVNPNAYDRNSATQHVNLFSESKES